MVHFRLFVSIHKVKVQKVEKLAFFQLVALVD